MHTARLYIRSIFMYFEFKMHVVGIEK
jgi:hypothetical protein